MSAPPSSPLDRPVTAPPLRVWSTDAVPPPQALAYWTEAVCEGFLEMAVAAPAQGAFSASLRSARLGPIGVNAVSGSAQDVARTPRAIRRSRENYYYLLAKTDEAWTCGQGERRARLLPGDLVLVDSRQCYDFHFPTRCDTVSLELPIDWVERWLADPAAHTGRRIGGQQGFGRALAAFATALNPELATAAPLPPGLLTDQLGALMALALEGMPAAAATASTASACQRLAAATREQLHERLGEPGLTVRDVAATLQVSERSVHRALAAAGTSFATELLALRMAEARRMLRDPRYRGLAVGEIGRRVGLLDPSHFVRLCRRHLGATPGALRRSGS